MLFSGGKDSNYALHKAIMSGQDVRVLCSMEPASKDSMLYHTPYINMTRLLAEAYELPLYTYKGAGDELKDLENLLKHCIEEYGIQGIVSGALLSDYQRIRYTMKAAELGLWAYNPLWRKNQEEYMRRLIQLGFQYIIVKISAYGIPMRLLGKPLTMDDVEEIIRLARKYGFNPAFEGGEAETLVLDSPLMKKRLEVEGEKLVLNENEGYYQIRKVKLVEKT